MTAVVFCVWRWGLGVEVWLMVMLGGGPFGVGRVVVVGAHCQQCVCVYVCRSIKQT